AEDGIRDDLVTGVQTCALPIYLLAPAAAGLGAEVVERGRPCDLAEPGPGARPMRVVALPEPACLLERVGGQILGGRPIAGQVDEIGRASCRERGWVEGGGGALG